MEKDTKPRYRGVCPLCGRRKLDMQEHINGFGC